MPFREEEEEIFNKHGSNIRYGAQLKELLVTRSLLAKR
jgi:hypothetical protein